MAIENVSLVSPWVEYYRKLNALFREDPDVNVIYNEEKIEVRIYVNGSEKVEAIAQLLPEEKVFGNVTLNIVIVPDNSFGLLRETNRNDLFKKAFSGNGAFSFVKTIKGVFNNDITYVVFKSEVVRYYNDDLGDIYGCRTTLYQELAKEVFVKQEGVFYCTFKDKFANQWCVAF